MSPESLLSKDFCCALITDVPPPRRAQLVYLQPALRVVLYLFTGQQACEPAGFRWGSAAATLSQLQLFLIHAA